MVRPEGRTTNGPLVAASKPSPGAMETPRRGFSMRVRTRSWRRLRRLHGTPWDNKNHDCYRAPNPQWHIRNPTRQTSRHPVTASRSPSGYRSPRTVRAHCFGSFSRSTDCPHSGHTEIAPAPRSYQSHRRSRRITADHHPRPYHRPRPAGSRSCPSPFSQPRPSPRRASPRPSAAGPRPACRHRRSR